MTDDGRRRTRRWPGLMLSGTGLLVTALATTYVIQTGASATATELPAPIRTVVATAGPGTPDARPEAVTVTVDPAADPERPVLLQAPGSAARPMTDLRQIVYTVAGNQRPDDPVTIVYADETGTLRTAIAATLPWTLTITPVLPVNYVTASSRGSQLNCWITDAGGATVAADTEFAPSTTCNR